MRSEPPGVSFSHWTIAAAEQAFLIVITLLLVFHFIGSVYLPPTKSELYYWSWAKNLQSSNYVHPPLVAYLIAASTALFGDSLFGLRFFSCVSSFFILVILKQLTQKVQILTYLLFTPVYLIGSIFMSPDSPLLFFWTCYLAWVTLVNRPLTQWAFDPISRAYHKSPIPITHWFLGGILLGAGLLAKFTMVIAIPCSFLVFATKYRARAWLLGYCLHLGVAIICLTPIIYFNIHHNLTPIAFQWSDFITGSGISIRRLLESLGEQTIMLGALPLLLFPWILINRVELSENNVLHVSYYFFVLPFILFLLQALRTTLDANWALVSYVAFWPLAQALLDRSSFQSLTRIIIRLCFIVPIITSVVLLIHLIRPIRKIPISYDVTSRMASTYQLSKQIAQDLKTSKETVYTPADQWVSYLRFQGIPVGPLLHSDHGIGFSIQSPPICEMTSVLYLSETLELKENELNALSCFKQKKILKTYRLEIRGEITNTLYLFQYYK